MIPYGHSYDVQTEWCIEDAGAPGAMLCGRRRGLPQAIPPLFPRFVHQTCRELWFRTDRVTREKSWALKGQCATCLGRVQLDARGLVVAHNEWSFRFGKFGPTDRPCDGAGELPEVES